MEAASCAMAVRPCARRAMSNAPPAVRKIATATTPPSQPHGRGLMASPAASASGSSTGSI
jgi:hypothetical protein